MSAIERGSGSSIEGRSVGGRSEGMRSRSLSVSVGVEDDNFETDLKFLVDSNSDKSPSSTLKLRTRKWWSSRRLSRRSSSPVDIWKPPSMPDLIDKDSSSSSSLKKSSSDVHLVPRSLDEQALHRPKKRKKEGEMGREGKGGKEQQDTKAVVPFFKKSSSRTLSRHYFAPLSKSTSMTINSSFNDLFYSSKSLSSPQKEMKQQMQDGKDGIKRITPTVSAFKHSYCFCGSSLVSWMISHKKAKTRKEGVKFGKQCCEIGEIVQVSPLTNYPIFYDNQNVYAFVEGEVGTKPGVVRSFCSEGDISLNPSSLLNCSLPQLVKLLFTKQSGVRTQQQKHKKKFYKHCALANEIVDWIVSNTPVKSRSQAVGVGRLLQSDNLIDGVGHDQVFADKPLFYKKVGDVGVTRPQVGRLFVTIVSASGVDQTSENVNYYCVLKMEKETITTSPFSTPSWNEKFELGLYKDSSWLKCSLWQQCFAEGNGNAQKIGDLVVPDVIHFQKPEKKFYKFKKQKKKSKKEQGMVLDLHFIAADKTSFFEKLEKLLVTEFGIVKCILSHLRSTKQSAVGVASGIAYLYHVNNKILTLLTFSISQEVKHTTSQNLLFRDESTATTILSAFCKYTGKDFVKKALSKNITDVINGGSIEINPLVVQSEEELEENSERLFRLLNRIMRSLLRASIFIPNTFREMVRCLEKKIIKRFPDIKTYKIIGGILFLRWICPAIVSPEKMGLLSSDVDPQPKRRRLILIAKILQATSNEVYYAEKEAYMQKVNVFIKENVSTVHELYDSFLSSPIETTESESEDRDKESGESSRDDRIRSYSTEEMNLFEFLSSTSPQSVNKNIPAKQKQTKPKKKDRKEPKQNNPSEKTSRQHCEAIYNYLRRNYDAIHALLEKEDKEAIGALEGMMNEFVNLDFEEHS